MASRTRHHRRSLPIVLLLLALTAGCGDGPAPRPTDDTTRAQSLSEPTTTAPPQPITEPHAGRVLRELPVPPGFRPTKYCLNGTGPGCEQPSRPRWSMFTTWRGADLAPGRPRHGRTLILAGVLAHRDVARARRSIRTIRRGLTDGRIDEPIRRSSPGRYWPGRRGRGTTNAAAIGPWKGITGIERVRMVYLREPPADGVVHVETALRRGRFTIQVIGILSDRSGAREPIAEVTRVTSELVRRLDAGYTLASATDGPALPSG